MLGPKLIVRPLIGVTLGAIILVLCIGSGIFPLPNMASTANVAATVAPVARPTPNLLEAPLAQTGQPAIDFALNNLAGELVWLSDLRGKVVIITFWATWCPPCQAEIPELSRAYVDLKDQGVVILAVDVRESLDVVHEFVLGWGMNYPVLLDPRGYLAYAYGVRGIPTSFFIDRQGILREVRVGGMTKEIIRSVLQSIDS
jgi:cytochrome c biogenesis protein CcmG, thiol:disulfide interchange protein DsbE